MLPLQVEAVDFQLCEVRSPISLCIPYDGSPSAFTAHVQKLLDEAMSVVGDDENEIRFLPKQDEITAGLDIIRIFLIAVCWITRPKDHETAKRYLREDAVRQIKLRLEMAGECPEKLKIPIRVVSGFCGHLVFPDKRDVKEQAPPILDELLYIQTHGSKRTSLAILSPRFPVPLIGAIVAVLVSAFVLLLQLFPMT